MTIVLEHRRTSSMDVSHPRWVFIQLLEHCNLRCRMCYEWGDHGAYHDKKALHRLDINVVEKVIEDCTPGRPLYDLYGGEPLLYRDIWAVLQAIRRAGSRAQMPTNGTLLAKSAERLVEAGLHRIWVSLDGPPEINDRQRGPGVFTRAVEGIDRLQAVRRRRGVRYPLIGINTVVTPLNYRHLKTFFFEALDLTKVDCISLELQAYLTAQNHRQYEELLQREFGVSEARVAKGFVNDPAIFTDIDVRLLADQVAQITEACERRGLMLSTYPTVMSEENIRKYFDARWHSMSSVRTRCAFPWISTEINARGDVTSCHAFYDLTLGNVYESSIIDIWRGDRYAHYRRHLRKNLLPICQSCVLFYEDQGALQGSGTPCNPRAN